MRADNLPPLWGFFLYPLSFPGACATWLLAVVRFRIPSGEPQKQIDAAFAGRDWDDDADLYYNRARWYDAGTGRFISQDPIGFAGGDTNLYRYAGGDPVNFSDPSGLFLKKLWRETKRVINDVADFVDDSGDYVEGKYKDTVRSLEYIARNPEDAFKSAIKDPTFWAGLALGPLFSASFSYGFFNVNLGLNGLSTGIDFLGFGKQALSVATGGGFNIGLPSVNIASPIFNYASSIDVGAFAASSSGSSSFDVTQASNNEPIVRGQGPSNGRTWGEYASGWGDIVYEGGAGLAQGGANLLNAGQDIIGESYNLFAYGANGIAWAEEQVGILGPNGGLPYYDADAWDWSRGRIRPEYGEPGSWSDMHGWSKFSGTVGIEVAGAAKSLAQRGAKLAKEVVSGGAARAAEYGHLWQRGSLQKAISRHAGDNSTSWLTNTGKRIYENPATGRQVVHDLEGAYFRIFQPDEIGSRVGDNLDMLGKVPSPARHVKGGATKNIPLYGSDLQQSTHFLIE